MAIGRSSSETEFDEEKLSGPGRLLREARMARNLDVEQVAASLHLHLTIIERIETDDYENLPAPTFVRGYLRGYARMLDLSPDSIVSAYNSHEFEPPPLVRDIARGEEVRSTDFPFQMATYGIVAVVVILVAIWWQSQEPGVPSPRALASLSETSESAEASVAFATQETTELGTTATNEILEESVEPGSLPTTDDDTTGAEPATPSETGSRAMENTLAQVTSSQVEGTTTRVEEALSTQVSTDGADSAVPIPQPSPAAASASALPSTGAQLVVKTGAESWVEIYGEDNKRLYYSLARPGSVIEIEHPGQLRVLLGNATNIEVEWKGEPFDIAPHISAGVARFHLTP